MKNLLLLYSKYSPFSSSIIQSIPADVKQYFYFLCIDNENIRKYITEKIQTVPAVVMVGVNNQVSIYESSKVGEIIAQITSLHTQYLEREKRVYLQAQKLDTEATPIEEIMGMEEKESFSSVPEVSKRKIRGANIPIRELPPLEDITDGGMAVSSSRPYIPRGEGHENMARSSLKQVADIEREGELLGGEEIEPIRQEEEPTIKLNKKSPEELKRRMEEMQREREDLDRQHEIRKN